MKDWKTILLEQIIRENLLTEQTWITTPIKRGGAGSNQFERGEANNWIRKFDVFKPDTSVGSPKRVFVQIKSKVTDWSGSADSFSPGRQKRIIDFLNNTVIGSKSGFYKQEAGVDGFNDWVWFISDPRKNRSFSKDTEKEDAPGKQFFLIAGLPKTDIKHFDVNVPGYNDFEPTARLSNNNPVYTEEDIAKFTKLITQPEYKVSFDQEDLINQKNTLTQGELRKEIQSFAGFKKYLYSLLEYYIITKGMDNADKKWSKQLTGIKSAEFDQQSGWSNSKTQSLDLLSTMFYAFFNEDYKFNTTTQNNMEIPVVDNTFYDNFVQAYFKLLGTVPAFKAIDIHEQRIPDGNVIINDDGNVVYDPNPIVIADNKIWICYNGDSKSVSENDFKAGKFPGATRGKCKVKTDTDNKVKPDTDDKPNIPSNGYMEITKTQEQQLLTAPAGFDGKKGDTTFYLYNKFYIHKVNAESGAFAFKLRKHFNPSEVSGPEGTESSLLDYKIVPYAFRFVKQDNSSKIRFTVYGVIIRFKSTPNKLNFLTVACTNEWNKSIVPSTYNNAVIHPEYYNEHSSDKGRWGWIWSSDEDGSGYYKQLFFKLPKTKYTGKYFKDIKVNMKLDGSDIHYSKLNLTQKIVGKIYAGSSGAGTYEDTLYTGITWIKDYNQLFKVMKYMNRMTKVDKDWFIPANMSIEKFKRLYRESVTGVYEFPKDNVDIQLGLPEYYDDGVYQARYSKKNWPGRWAPFVGTSALYSNGSYRYSGLDYNYNVFCNLIIGELEDYLEWYEKVYNYFYDKAETFKLDTNSEVGLTPLSYSETEYQKAGGFLLIKPDIL